MPTIRGEVKKARAGNYETSSCLFEFIDNSLDAGADRIRVDIRERSGTGNPHKLLISDNAPAGIPLENLKAVFSWTYERKRSETDVGEYGTGFKTASVNLAEKLTVLTKHDGRSFQAVADWQDMADEDRWDPKVMEIGTDYFHDAHPFNHGTTFILEGLRNETLCAKPVDKKLVVYLFRKVFDDIAYHYRYLLHENENLHLSLKGVAETDGEICEMDVREHDLFRKTTDPFYFKAEDNPDAMETLVMVYQDSLQFYRVYFQNTRTKKWEGVEFVEKRKNGNSVLRCREVVPSLFDSMRLMDTLTFRSIHLRDPEHSSTCMGLYPTCTLDIIRRGRVMGRDLNLRAPRAEPLSWFVKHEVWYHSYQLNALLGIQYNKQNYGVLRDNDLRYTMEHLQQMHEREFYKAEKAVPPPPPPIIQTEPSPPPIIQTEPSPPQAPPPPLTATTTPQDPEKRKNFTPSIKIQTLNRQECRDSVMDFVLKDSLLLMEYDHINGSRSMNTKDNCQALSVIMHSLKSRRPEVFEVLEKDGSEKVAFIVGLLNCITRSRYFIDAWVSGTILVRDPQQQLYATHEGLFFLQN
jgi:hypothetical protein